MRGQPTRLSPTKEEPTVDVAKLEARGDAPGLVKVLGSRNEGKRGSAWGALERLGAPAVPAVAAAIRDPKPEVRQIAARILGKIGGPQAVQPLVTALWDQDYYVRDWASAALADIGSPVVNAALKDQSENVRQVAAEAIASVDERREKEQARRGRERWEASDDGRRSAAAKAHAAWAASLCGPTQHEFKGQTLYSKFHECQRCGAFYELDTGTVRRKNPSGQWEELGKMRTVKGVWRVVKE